MLKLNQEDSLSMYYLLKDLKKNNWYIDIRNLILINQIIEFHFKITEMVSAYDGFNFLEQLSYMVKDMADYYKQDIKTIPKKKCIKCRRLFPMEEFLSNRKCLECRKK
jgi:hypothetical protein